MQQMLHDYEGANLTRIRRSSTPLHRGQRRKLKVMSFVPNRAAQTGSKLVTEAEKLRELESRWSTCCRAVTSTDVAGLFVGWVSGDSRYLKA